MYYAMQLPPKKKLKPPLSNHADAQYPDTNTPIPTTKKHAESHAVAKKKIVIIGELKDIRTGEPLPGATVYLKSQKNQSVFTDNNGWYRLEVEISAEILNSQQEDILVSTSAGYTPSQRIINLLKCENLLMRFSLNKKRSDKTQTDQELVELAMQGHQLAFDKIVKRYRDTLFFTINRMINSKNDADDIIMTTFAKAFQPEVLQTYNPESGAFSTWIYRMAINRAIDFRRKKRLNTNSLDDISYATTDEDGLSVGATIATDSLDPHEEIVRQERIKLVRTMVDSLKPKYKVIAECRHIKQMTYEEMAEFLQLPIGTIKAQVKRTNDFLRSALLPRLKEINS